MMPLDIDPARLAKLLGMPGSNHDGEVLSAARQAERLRRDAGVTWFDVLQPALPAPNAADGIGDDIEECFCSSDLLNDWENKFLRSLLDQRSPISAKQREIVAQILTKVRRRR